MALTCQTRFDTVFLKIIFLFIVLKLKGIKQQSFGLFQS